MVSVCMEDGGGGKHQRFLGLDGGRWVKGSGGTEV